MKMLIVTLALALLAVPAFAAIEYEFIQRNTSDLPDTPATDLTARALVDGSRTRVDFLGGTLYPPGTYVVTTDGSRRLFFVDPVKQWYTEFNAVHAATALGTANIRIDNLKSDVRKLDDRQTIAGIDATHYRLTMNYDITLTVRNLPLRQRVQTEIDTWVTDRFSASLQDVFNTEAIRTGNTSIDQILEAETRKIPGFPLRRTITTRTFFDGRSRNSSKVQPPTTRTIVREMLVTKIIETPADPAKFMVPVSYRRADQPEQKTASHLTFDPPAN